MCTGSPNHLGHPTRLPDLLWLLVLVGGSRCFCGPPVCVETHGDSVRAKFVRVRETPRLASNGMVGYVSMRQGARVNGVYMKQAKARLAAIIISMLCGIALYGCSAQVEASSEAVDPAQVQKEQLISELKSAIGNEGYQSVTVDIVGTAGAEAADQDEDAELGQDYETGDYEESDEGEYAEDGDSWNPDEVDGELVVSAKCDRSGETVRMQTRVEEGETVFEFYVNGDNAVMVMDSQAASGKLSEFKMPQYGDVESLIRLQLADVSLFEDAIDDIQKEEGEDGVTYKVACDPTTFASRNSTANACAQLPKNVKLNKAELVYHVNAENQITGITSNVSGSNYSSSYACVFHDYNATDVEDGPESTVSIKQMITGESDEDESSGEAGEEDFSDEEYVDYEE